MPERNFTSDNYRFGFNGQETVIEIYSTNAGYLDYTFRGYNPRLARFLATDPLFSKYPMYSPYSFAANQPIHAVEIEGLESSNDKNPTSFVAPKSPDLIDPKVWTLIPEGTGTEQGHTFRWTDKDGNMLAYDAPQTNLRTRKTDPGGFHFYNSNGQRLGIDGKLAGYDVDGVRVYKWNQLGGPGDSHIKPGQTTNIKISNAANSVSLLFSIVPLLTNSPNSPLYLFQSPGTGSPNKAYPTNIIDGYPYYEWRWNEDGLREIQYFNSYFYQNGTWRGQDPVGKKEYFDSSGNPVKMN